MPVGAATALGLSTVIVLRSAVATSGRSPYEATDADAILGALEVGAAVITSVVYWVVLSALIAHLSTLMRRIPRRRLAAVAQAAFWGLLIATPTAAVGAAWACATYQRASPALNALGSSETATVPPSPAGLEVFMAGATVGALGACAIIVSGVGAALVLILACAALFRAAREAANNAALAQPPAPALLPHPPTV